jgi:hypothetical protein
MSIDSSLRISDYGVFSWANELPIDFIPILSFIFLPDENKVYREEEDGEEYFSFSYVSDVKKVKNRFKSFSFTIPEIDKTISEIIDLPLRKMKLIAYFLFWQNHSLESGEGGDKLNSDLIKFLVEFEDDNFKNDFILLVYNLGGYELEEIEYDSSEETVDDGKDDYTHEDEFNLLKFQQHDLGNYLDLRDICIFLELSNDEDMINLDLSSAHLFGIETPESLESLSLVLDIYNSRVEVKQKYLERAKIHFTEHRFDLVYVELFISVEAALYSYEKTKYLQLSENGEEKKLGTILKKVSLLDRIRILVVFIGQYKLDGELISVIEKAYETRNQIVHLNRKRFALDDSINAIKAVEKLINIINLLE